MTVHTLNQRDIDFLLYEFLDTEGLLERPRYSDHSRESFDATISGVRDIATNLYANHYQEGDEHEPLSCSFRLDSWGDCRNRYFNICFWNRTSSFTWSTINV